MEAGTALERAQEAGVPIESLALYGRWWQLERWLRTLAYLVLRSAWGSTWTTELARKASKYAANDNYAHIRGPDKEDLIGYLDFGGLVRLIQDQWELFSGFLLPRDIWPGRIAELQPIRNGIGHVRRAGTADRRRVEQLLSDLEPGYREALRALECQTVGQESASLSGDPVVADFYSGRLRRACQHAESKYKFDIDLGFSTMPWAMVDPSQRALSQTAGVLWHIDIGGPDRWSDLTKLAMSIQPIRESVVFVFAVGPSGARLAVPVVDDAEDVCSALAHFVESYGSCTYSLSSVPRDAEQVLADWYGTASTVDPRILIDHPLATATSPDEFGTFFGVP